MQKKILILPIILIILAFSILFVSCTSFKIENVTFGWNAEYFATPDDNGNFTVPKYSMTFNVLSILKEENIIEKPSAIKFHIIRDDDGYIFLAADKFKNVWVFESSEKSLKLHAKLDLTEKQPLNDPKFNENKPNIKVFTQDKKEFVINKDGVIKKEEKK
jgi:hypothetical protein